MENKFNVGDVVKLKSGGPVMTISNFGEYDGGKELYTCQWFNVNGYTYQKQEEFFVEKVLEKFD